VVKACFFLAAVTLKILRPIVQNASVLSRRLRYVMTPASRFPLSSAPQSIYCSQDASNSWHRFREHVVKHMAQFVVPSRCNHFFVETSSQTILRNWSPACLLNCGSSTVFKGIFRATYARYIDATPLFYDLTEPPSLLQIDSKNPLGVQRMGLPRCSKALSEPFVLDRCRTSLLFDATSKSHANRFQRSVGYSNSASSMLFKRIFRTACARFIDATPLSCDLAEPPSLLQTAIAYLNRASSMSFIFFLSNPFPSIFRQIPRIYLRNRLPSLLFQVDATILMLKHVSHFLFEHVFRASGEDAVIF